MGLHFGGLRKKVVKNFIIVILLVVFAFEIRLAVFYSKYYYSSITQALNYQVTYTNAMYNSPSMQSLDFETRAQAIYEKQMSSPNSKYAVDIVDRNGRLIIDQYGFHTDEKCVYDDVKQALQNQSNLVPIVYREKSTKEKVMSVSVPIKVNGIVQGAVRYSVSLKYVDIEIIKIISYLLFFGLMVIMMAVGLSIKFADSMIGPLTELKIFSNMLAKGNYNIKINKKRISDDEIGELAKTFENMAQEIQKSEKLKDEFISSISHELRTPLTSINGWSETLQLENISKEELSMGLNIIQDETQRLVKLVEELLDFSRISSNRLKLNTGEVNMENLVVSVVNQLRSIALGKKIKLTVEFLNQDIKPIYADKNRLRQVMINLIQNAIKFTPEGGHILVRLDQFEMFTEVSVEDNGIGIEEQNIPKVSKKFFQEDYNKAGSGLGLAICSEIVKMHGGSINIKSKKNMGTTVTFTVSNDIRQK